jgi:hypothetical protein
MAGPTRYESEDVPGSFCEEVDGHALTTAELLMAIYGSGYLIVRHLCDHLDDDAGPSCNTPVIVHSDDVRELEPDEHAWVVTGTR